METQLQSKGWFVSKDGIKNCENISEIKSPKVNDIIQAALQCDLHNIGKKSLPENICSGQVEKLAGPIVLQVQKIRNLTAPLINQTSKAAPRMLKLNLSDGFTHCVAIEFRPLSTLPDDVIPGTKVCLFGSNIEVTKGTILLKNNGDIKVLGGFVEKLKSKWEASKNAKSNQRYLKNKEDAPPLFKEFSSQSYRSRNAHRTEVNQKNSGKNKPQDNKPKIDERQNKEKFDKQITKKERGDSSRDKRNTNDTEKIGSNINQKRPEKQQDNRKETSKSKGNEIRNRDEEQKNPPKFNDSGKDKSKYQNNQPESKRPQNDRLKSKPDRVDSRNADRNEQPGERHRNDRDRTNENRRKTIPKKSENFEQMESGNRGSARNNRKDDDYRRSDYRYDDRRGDARNPDRPGSYAKSKSNDHRNQKDGYDRSEKERENELHKKSYSEKKDFRNKNENERKQPFEDRKRKDVYENNRYNNERETNGRDYSEGKSRRDYYGDKSGRDYSGEKSGKDYFGGKSDRDSSGGKSGRDYSGGKGGRDYSGGKGGRDYSGGKGGRDYSGDKSGRDYSGDKSGRDYSGDKSGRDYSGDKSRRDYSGDKSRRDYYADNRTKEYYGTKDPEEHYRDNRKDNLSTKELHQDSSRHGSSKYPRQKDSERYQPKDHDYRNKNKKREDDRNYREKGKPKVENIEPKKPIKLLEKPEKLTEDIPSSSLNDQPGPNNPGPNIESAIPGAKRIQVQDLFVKQNINPNTTSHLRTPPGFNCTPAPPNMNPQEMSMAPFINQPNMRNQGVYDMTSLRENLPVVNPVEQVHHHGNQNAYSDSEEHYKARMEEQMLNQQYFQWLIQQQNNFPNYYVPAPMQQYAMGANYMHCVPPNIHSQQPTTSPPQHYQNFKQ